MQGSKKHSFTISWIYEMCILAILSRGDSYGYDIAKSSNMNMSESTTYPILRRLEKSGYLESYSQQCNSKLRRFYRITTAGHEQLTRLNTQWKEYKKRVDNILDGRL